MGSSEPLIECESLSKKYDNVVALDSVDLHIRKGETFALLGPNGAGKSTLIKILTGILAPDTGRVTVLGMNPLRQRKKVSGSMGVLLENAAPYPHMTGTQYLAYFSKLFFPREPKAKRQERIDSCLQIAGLTKAGRLETWRYSHGMKKRLLFARALINDPEVLVLDEPLTGLDPVVAARFKERLRELNHQGRTIFFSTHILSDAEQLCRSVGILYGGRMLVQGSFRDLQRRFPSRRFRITVRNVDENLIRVFKSMAFVVEVIMESEETLLVETENMDTDKARRLIWENSPSSVLSVSPAQVTLDEIFLKVVDRSWQVN